MQVLCACDSVAVRVLAVLVRVLAMAVALVCMLTVVVLTVRVMLVSLVVVLVVLAVTVRVLAALVVLAVAVRVLAVLARVLAVFVLAVPMFAVTVLVIAMRVIVLVSQVRLLVPERWHKRLAKSMTQQVAADKHAPGLFLRFVTRNRPCALYQVKLDPLITARQRTFCTRKLSKNASRRCVQKPNQVRWTWKLSMSQRHSLQVRPLVLLASWIFKNRTVKRASQQSIPPLVGNISI